MSQKLTKTATSNLIRSTFRKLHYALDPHSSFTSGNYADQAFYLELPDEKAHRASFTSGERWATSANDAAKYFVCKWLLEYTYINPTLTIKATDLLDTRKAALLCCAIAARYSGAIKSAISKQEAVHFLDSLEYPFS